MNYHLRKNQAEFINWVWWWFGLRPQTNKHLVEGQTYNNAYLCKKFILAMSQIVRLAAVGSAQNPEFFLLRLFASRNRHVTFLVVNNCLFLLTFEWWPLLNHRQLVMICIIFTNFCILIMISFMILLQFSSQKVESFSNHFEVFSVKIPGWKALVKYFIMFVVSR